MKSVSSMAPVFEPGALGDRNIEKNMGSVGKRLHFVQNYGGIG